MSAAVAAVDWGTSSFRAWLLDAGGNVLAERRSSEGMLTASRVPGGFSAVLEASLDAMQAEKTLPAIICGMAGARTGWIEAPYVDVPASLVDVLGGAIKVPSVARDVRIVPGMAQRLQGAPDVMRGEETQLAGAAAELGEGRHQVCMPGTHSKWVNVVDGQVAGFSTFMTGELYSVLSRNTTLAGSFDAEQRASADSPVFKDAFLAGLGTGGDFGAKLFGLRAGKLLFDLQPQDAAARLSGLLIGAEVASARAGLGSGDTVALVASGALHGLYAAALRLAGLVVNEIDADEAVLRGLYAAARRNGLVG